MNPLPRLRIRKNEDRRLRGGHLWVFSNEVDTTATPLKSFARGDLAVVESAKGESIGVAYVNPDSLISARLLCRDPATAIDAGFFTTRIERALQLRSKLYQRPFYRLVYGESDGLPGVIVDRFDDVFVVQISTAGMEQRIDLLLTALEAKCAPRVLVLKNTSGLRELEGLDNYVRIAKGELTGPVEVEENGAVFIADPVQGQKTGWFFDHRDSRAAMARWCSGQRVLDLFAYSGAWGVQAAKAWAVSVECVDSSESALALAAENAKRNGVESRMSFQRADVFDFLRAAREQRQRYDIVIADPPAFIKRKKDASAGIEAYRRLNQAALQVLAPGGILISASCSFHLQRDVMHDLLRASARHLDRHLVFLGRGGQASDHPIHPAIPETEYLKTFYCAVNPAL